MKLGDIYGGKIKKDGVLKDVIEVRLGRQLIWPIITYQFSNVQFVWSEGSYFYANGSNTAYATATVKKYVGERLDSTTDNVVLTPSLTSEHFKVSGTTISAYNLGTTFVYEGYTAEVILKYLDSTVGVMTISQQYNHVENTVVDRNVSFSLNTNAVSAKNGSLEATLNIFNDTTYTYTSGADKTERDNNGTAKIYRILGTNTQLVKSDVANGDVNTITFPENQTGNARNFTLLASLDGYSVSASETITQAAGTKTYSDITWISATASLIPAKGGDTTLDSTARQTWGWNGATTGGGSEDAEGTYKTISGSTHADSLGTTIIDERSVGTVRASVTMHGKSSTTDIDVRQAANYVVTHRDAIDTTTAWAFELNDDSVGCSDSYVTLLNCKRTYDYTTAYDYYASTTETGGVKTTGMKASANPTALSCSGATVSLDDLKVSVGKNAYNDNSRTFTVKASYGDFSDSHNFTQAKDSIINTAHNIKANTYTVDAISSESSNIGAAGGTAQLGTNAYHYEDTVYTWESGADNTYGTDVYVADGITWSIVSISADGVYGVNATGLVSHRDMKTSETTDTCTVRAYNSSNTSAYADTSYSVKNSKSVKTAAYDVTTGFYIGLSSYSVICTGGTITVSGTEQYTHYDTLYSYTSGSESGGGSSAQTRGATPSVSCDGATVSGTSVSIPSRTRNTASTTFTVNGSWGSYSSSQECTRTGDSYTDSSTNFDYYATATIDSSNVSASGGSASLYFDAGHKAKTVRNWTYGGAEDLGTITVTDSYSVSTTGGSHFSRSGMEVSHEYMGTRAETDSVTYTVYNSADTSKYQSVSLSATNTRSESSEDVRSLSYTYGTTIPGDGGSVSISYVSKRNTSWSYTSGASGTDSTGISSTLSASIGSFSPVSVSGEGTSTLTVGANSGSQRSIDLYMNNVWKNSITQAATTVRTIYWDFTDYTSGDNFYFNPTSGSVTTGQSIALTVYNKRSYSCGLTLMSGASDYDFEDYIDGNDYYTLEIPYSAVAEATSPGDRFWIDAYDY